MAFVNAPNIAGTGNVDFSEDVSRKRLRVNDVNDFSLNVQPQMVADDGSERIVIHHGEKARAEAIERRRFAKEVMMVAEERVSKRLRAKEDEIEQIWKLNWALEEKMKSLITENQVWRYLAQANETAAIALRANLEQVLLEQTRVKEVQIIAVDEESCCGDNFDVGEDNVKIMRDIRGNYDGINFVCYHVWPSCTIQES